MVERKLSDRRVRKYTDLISPRALKESIPLTDSGIRTVLNAREGIEKILDGNDQRKLLIVGPCSIHDIDQAKDYGQKLKDLAEEVRDHFLVVMRTFFEKPRTTVGWTGFVYDPDLNGLFRMKRGVSYTRELLVHLVDEEVPCAVELLNMSLPSYFDDAISWGAIGARTVESQLHRHLASGMSMVVGFKNDTKGNVQPAIDGMKTARESHCFPGTDQNGMLKVVDTIGNPYTHLILRGGIEPNYSAEHVANAQSMLKEDGLLPNVMVDCSHGNSGKKHENQLGVFYNVIRQITDGDQNIIGLMVESNLREGKQELGAGLSTKDCLELGVSVTDACLGWEQTAEMIHKGYAMIKKG